MSLLDALLLDPPRINTWIADRNDGIAGSGTQMDPYDGSTLAKFDTVMSTVGEFTCVHLGPGEFETAGYYDGIGGTHWEAKKGMRIVGSGIDVTKLKLVTTVVDKRVYAIGHTLSAIPVDFFEVCDLSVNCNFADTGSTWTAGAVRVMGNHARVARVKVWNWGNKSTDVPGFVIAVLTGDPSVDVDGVTNCGIVDCIAIGPHASAAGKCSVFHVGGKEAAQASDDEAVGIGPYIRNCFVDCGQTSDFSKDFRALSMAWCKGGVVEGNQVHNTKFGGPHHPSQYESTGARDLVVRNNVYRNVYKGPYWNLGTEAKGVKTLIVEGNLIELATTAASTDYAIDLESTAGSHAYGNIMVRKNRISYVDGQAGDANGIRVVNADNILVSENILELDPAQPEYPINNANCGSAHYSENRKPDGDLLRGYNETTGERYNEPETEVEEAFILGFMKAR